MKPTYEQMMKAVRTPAPEIEDSLLAIRCLCNDKHCDGRFKEHEVIDQKEGTRRYYRTPDKPFKPLGIFTFRFDEESTIDSISIGSCEQLINPIQTKFFLCPIDKDLLFTMWFMGGHFTDIADIIRIQLPIITPDHPVTVQITGALHDLIFWGISLK